MNWKKKICIDTFTDILFLIGAMIGWLYEVVLHFATHGELVNRGILHGPWLPIYGTGCIIMVGFKMIIGNKPVRYFVVSMSACGVIEYVTSWLMEITYHTRWWDYSDLPWNLSGRIFVGGLVGFGIAGCLFVYGLLPVLKKIYGRMPSKTKKEIALILLVVFLADILVSLICPNMGVGITHIVA